MFNILRLIRRRREWVWHEKCPEFSQGFKKSFEKNPDKETDIVLEGLSSDCPDGGAYAGYKIATDGSFRQTGGNVEFTPRDWICYRRSKKIEALKIIKDISRIPFPL